VSSRRLTSSAASEVGLGTDVDPAPEECAGRDDNGVGAKATPLERLDASDSTLLVWQEKAGDSSLNGMNGWVAFKLCPDGSAIPPPIALGSRGPDGWSFSAVEHAELEGSQVGGGTHESAKGVDFSNDCSFGNTADGGIAGHLADGFEGAGNQADGCAKSGGGDGGLGSGVSGSDDDDVKVYFGEMRASHKESP